MTAHCFIAHSNQRRSFRKHIVRGDQRLVVLPEPSHSRRVVWIIPHRQGKPCTRINEDHASFLYSTASCSRPENPSFSGFPAHFAMTEICFLANSSPLRPVACPLPFCFFRESMNALTSFKESFGNPSNARNISFDFATINTSFLESLGHTKICLHNGLASFKMGRRSNQ